MKKTLRLHKEYRFFCDVNIILINSYIAYCTKPIAHALLQGTDQESSTDPKAHLRDGWRLFLSGSYVGE